jgi:hypothetical protein
MTANASELSGYASVGEPNLVFARGVREKHPLRGLINHGPYGMDLGVPREVRLASTRCSARRSRRRWIGVDSRYLQIWIGM